MVRDVASRHLLHLTHVYFFSQYGNSNGYGGHGGGYGGGYGGGGGGGGWGGDRMNDSLGGSLRTIDWSQQKQIPFEKNFYAEDKRVSSRSDREIEEFRRAKEIKVRNSFLVVIDFPKLFTFIRCKGIACLAL
jgi:hypothetical protein